MRKFPPTFQCLRVFCHIYHRILKSTERKRNTVTTGIVMYNILLSFLAPKLWVSKKTFFTNFGEFHNFFSKFWRISWNYLVFTFSISLVWLRSSANLYAYFIWIFFRNVTNLVNVLRKYNYSNNTHYPATIYLFKVNNRNTRRRCEICPTFIITTSERCHWCRSGVFIVNFKSRQLFLQKISIIYVWLVSKYVLAF